MGFFVECKMHYSIKHKLKARRPSAVGGRVEWGFFRHSKHLFFCHHFSNNQNHWQFNVSDSSSHVNAIHLDFAEVSQAFRKARVVEVMLCFRFSCGFVRIFFSCYDKF